MEELKECWSGARFRSEANGKNGSNMTPDSNRSTALETLASHYRRFSTIGLILALCMPICTWEAMRDIEGVHMGFKLALVTYGAIYCLIASVMDRWLCRGIEGIDVAEMPVSKVCRLTFYYRKKHYQFVGILIPLALLFLAGFSWVLSGDMWYIYGMAAGAVVGILIGTRQFSLFMSEYRDILKD